MWNYPIIDLHATWLVINPIQGCPNRCRYCFLNGVGLTGVKPTKLVEPNEAVDMLQKSELYMSEIPICIESQTDAFSTPKNIEYVLKLLQILDEKKIMNPKVFITKCSIPDYFIEEIKKYKMKGHKFIFMLSYSGLDKDIEIGIDKEKIKQNFTKLYESNMDIIHYWRPFLPQNSTKEKIMEVYNFVTQYAKCSIAIGLKVQDNFLEKMDFWPELLQNEKATRAESVWTKDAYEFMYEGKIQLKGKYPIYQTTSCALAYVLKECDRNAFLNTDECKKYNSCPHSQRKICEAYYTQFNKIDEQYIYQLLERLKKTINKKEIKITIDKKLREIHIDNIELGMKEFTYLTQVTRYKIFAKKNENDYYWNTSVNNTKQLLL